jgi:DNA-binding MarR family transcriptional regulator
MDARGSYDEAIELIYFAWRELVAEPDRLLARRGLSRVHHRIIFTIGRAPGLTIGGLCRVLDISKQALHQPLGALIEAGLVVRTVDPTNRRVRRLNLTPRGAQLEERLAAVQRVRFERAFRAAGRTAETHWRDVMKLIAGRDLKP